MAGTKYKPPAFLFDNDGVLIDSRGQHWMAWELLMKEEKDFHIDKELFEETFGKRNDLILQEISPHLSEARREDLRVRKEEIFRSCAGGKIHLMPGIDIFLKRVKEANIPRIIASSTPILNLQMYLSTTELGQYFDSFVSSEEVEHGKPHPDIFLEAAKRLGYDPKECVVFEDAPAGLEAARKAGCFVVALATSHRPEELTNYDLIFSAPEDLVLDTILERWKEWRKNVKTSI